MTLAQMLNPFEGKKQGEAPDDMQRIDAVFDKSLEGVLSALQLYKRSIKRDERSLHTLRTAAARTDQPLLTPSQLNMLVSYMTKSEHEWQDMVFVSYVLERTAKASDGVTLTIPTALCYLGAQMKGTKKLPLHIGIHGNVSQNCFEGSSHCDATVHGYTREYFGERSADCRFEVYGNCAQMGGIARSSRFIIHGNSDGMLGLEAANCLFSIDGDVEKIAPDMTGCTIVIGGRIRYPLYRGTLISSNRGVNKFYTTNNETFKFLQQEGMKGPILLDHMPTPEEVFK